MSATRFKTPITTLDGVRRERDRRLSLTDWRFRSDMAPTQAWIDYCQALRDLPANTPDPANVVWPTLPV